MTERRRILVVGNSTTYMVVPQPATIPPWPRLLEHRLRARGIDARVDLDPEWFGLLPDGARRWREQWRGHHHDVLVIVYGFVDMQPNLVPTPVVRWATTWDKGVGTRRARVRARATELVWPPLRRLARRTADNLAQVTWRVHPDTFARTLRAWIDQAVHDGTAVVVADIQPVVGRYEYAFPGLSARRDRYQRVIEAVVASAPAGVVRWRQSEIDPGPDALHFDEHGHLAAAEALERCIDEVLAVSVAPPPG